MIWTCGFTLFPLGYALWLSLQQSRGMGRPLEFVGLKGWARPEFLIIDDVGLGQVKRRVEEPTAAHTLYNLVDRRHGHVSTAVTSNIALRHWGRYLGDTTLTATTAAFPAAS